MYDRVSSEMIDRSTLNNINASLSSLQRSTEELSSGKKILEPSDDPYGASHIIELDSQIEGLEAYSSSVQDGIAWTQAASGAMSSIGEAVQRVRELLVEASNGTLNEGDLRNIGTEVGQLTEAIKQDANTQYAGQYIFSGTATTTAPYETGAEDEFQGNTETVMRAIGPGSTVNVGMNLSAVLGNGSESKDGKLLDVLGKIVGDLQEATPESRAELGGADLKSLEGSIEELSQLEAVTGSTTDQLKTAATRIETLQDSLTQALSNTQSANIAEVSIAYNSEQAAYSAALRAGANIIQESLLNFLQ